MPKWRTKTLVGLYWIHFSVDHTYIPSPSWFELLAKKYLAIFAHSSREREPRAGRYDRFASNIERSTEVQWEKQLQHLSSSNAEKNSSRIKRKRAQSHFAVCNCAFKNKTYSNCRGLSKTADLSFGVLGIAVASLFPEETEDCSVFLLSSVPWTYKAKSHRGGGGGSGNVMWKWPPSQVSHCI